MSGVTTLLRGASSWRTTLVVALGALGFLIAVQVQSQAPRARYTTQERDPLVRSALELQAQQDALKGAILAERARIEELEATGEGNAALVGSLNERLDAARLAAGLIPLHGPGVVIRLEDGPSAPGVGDAGERAVNARDVRTVVEELWLAGAEAIDVNRERIVASTALLDIGGSVLANAAYLTPPYDIAAIGAPGLYARLSASDGFASFVRARAGTLGIRIRFAELDDLPVAAYAGTVTLRHGRPIPSATPAAAPGDATTSEPSGSLPLPTPEVAP